MASQVAIKPLKQQSTNDCSLTCLLMLLDYYGINLTRDAVSSTVAQTAAGHIFMTELARFLIVHGCPVQCYAYNLFYTSPADATLPPDALIDVLTTEQRVIYDDWYRPRVFSTIQCLQEGVEYVIRKPTLDFLRTHLTQHCPILCSVSYCALHDVQGDPYCGHAIVLLGIEGDTVSFAEPEDGQIHTITLDGLFFAITARKVAVTSGYMLFAQGPVIS